MDLATVDDEIRQRETNKLYTEVAEASRNLKSFVSQHFLYNHSLPGVVVNSQPVSVDEAINAIQKFLVAQILPERVARAVKQFVGRVDLIPGKAPEGQ